MRKTKLAKNTITVVLAALGVVAMVTAPLFGAQLLTGVVFFGGAALTLTALVARAKQALTGTEFAAAQGEHRVEEIVDGALESTLSDVEFLNQAGICA